MSTDMKGMFDLDSAKKYNETKKHLISKDLIIGDIKSVEVKYWKEDKTEGTVDLRPHIDNYQKLIQLKKSWDIGILASQVEGLELLIDALRKYTNIAANSDINDQSHNINTQLLSILFSNFFSMENKVFIETIYYKTFDDWMRMSLKLDISSFSVPLELDETNIEHNVRIVGDALYAMYYGDDTTP